MIIALKENVFFLLKIHVSEHFSFTKLILHLSGVAYEDAD